MIITKNKPRGDDLTKTLKLDVAPNQHAPKAEGKLIGPAMKGIYERRHPAWVMNMLMNPTEMVKEDPIAKALLAEYNNILMINQNLSQEEARAIAEYLRSL